MEGPEIKSAEAVIDNGKYGKRTIRFEAGRLAQQAQGSAAIYLDGETMLFSATSASKQPKDQFDFFPLTIDVEERMPRDESLDHSSAARVVHRLRPSWLVV
jgi:polyribonucleotide nucleotidyltransferase